MANLLKFLRKKGPVIAGALLFAAGLFALHRLLGETHPEEILQRVRSIPVRWLVLAMGSTVLGYGALAGYDWSALRYVGRQLSLPTVGLISFIGFALSNTLGMGALTGAAVRYRLYSRLGLEPGDRIGIWSPNNYQWVLTQLATAQLGLILVTLNPAYRLAELEYALNRTACKALMLAQTFKSSDYLGMLRSLAPELDSCEPGFLVSDRLPHLKLVIHLAASEQSGMIAFNQLNQSANEKTLSELHTIAQGLQPDDAVNIQFTSGTTGFPKGATLSHCNILNNGYFVAEGMKFTQRDRLCIPVPLYHCFGMVMGVLGCITHAATMVFPNEAFDAQSVLTTIERERCSALFGVPTMFIAELALDNFSQFDLSSLRTGVMAGAPCPVDTMNRVISDMNMQEVTICYGMTETSPVSFQSAVDDPVAKRVSTVGKVHPHVEVKIINEEGIVVSRGERGELCTRGYSVMQGYWADAEKTAESIDAAGWMHSGDLAVIDEQGYCDIVGRVKDMIIRGGENVYPREVEEFLMHHPKIQDVSVFGVPDKRLGEQIAAWIQLNGDEVCTAEEIKLFCKDQIAHFKVPYYVRFVEEFPMTVTGKIQKFVMRETLLAELMQGQEAS